MNIAWWKGQIHVLKSISLKKKKKGATIGHCELIICTPRDFKNCMVIRAIISKYMHWLIDNSYQVKIIFISGYVEIIFF